MTGIIQLLPDHVANQIAAGEVVQRPASVVKELLENAIDAKAARITVVIRDAGKTLIQVTDDGLGMDVTDARLCFERHATSKIKTADDLFSLHTKGFRGEALASIAAIAHVELKTRQEEADLGTHLIIEGSEVKSQEPAVVPKGTTVSVKNLFYNIPARRNFLKSDAVEMRHIIDEFHRVALAHPDVGFQLLHNSDDLFNLPPTHLRQRIVHIFGSKTDERLVPVEEETEILKISGFVIKPEFAKKSRGEQFFFVNNRFIRSSYLHHGVVSAFEALIRNDQHPGYFLFLEVDPHSIDINIHPTKTEIKFDDEHAVYTLLRAAIKHSLGQFNIAPVLDFERDKNLDPPYEFQTRTPRMPTIEVDRDFNPFREESQKTGPPVFQKKQTSWESLYTGLKSPGSEAIHEFESSPDPEKIFEDQEFEEKQLTLQIQNKYLVSPVKNGMVVVNQNLAHQRVLYEELLKNITVKEAVSQQLLFPLKLDFSRPDMAILENIKEQLEFTGFIFSNFGQEQLSISGIPVLVQESRVEDLLNEMIAAISAGIPESSFSQNDLLARSMARSMAIRNGVFLNSGERSNLIDQLFACKEPTVCPAGKPVFKMINSEDLDRKFM